MDAQRHQGLKSQCLKFRGAYSILFLSNRGRSDDDDFVQNHVDLDERFQGRFVRSLDGLQQGRNVASVSDAVGFFRSLGDGRTVFQTDDEAAIKA